MGGSRRGWVLSMKFRASSLDCSAIVNIRFARPKLIGTVKDRRSQEARTRRPSDGGCLRDETPQRAALARARAAARAAARSVPRTQLSRRCAHVSGHVTPSILTSRRLSTTRFHGALQISHVNRFRSPQDVGLASYPRLSSSGSSSVQELHAMSAWSLSAPSTAFLRHS